MKAIFERSPDVAWRRLFRDSAFGGRILIVGCRDESVLAPVLRVTGKAHPQVDIKSRAKMFGPDVAFRITLSSAGASPDSFQSNPQAAEHEFQVRLGRAGIHVLSSEAL